MYLMLKIICNFSAFIIIFRNKLAAVNYHAHNKMIVDVQCHPIDDIMCTRSCDNTMKLWKIDDLSVSH